MMNSAMLVGRLTRNPEVKKTQTGKSVVNFTVACDSGYGDKKKTDFVNCQAWNSTADFIGNYLTKGSLVAVEGSNQSRSYDDSTGRKVYIQEILAKTVKSLSSRDEQQHSAASASTGSQDNNYASDDVPTISMDDQPVLDITSDDLPF